MAKRLTVVAPNGTVTHRDFGSKIPYEALRYAAGGPIQEVPYFNKYEGRRCQAYCNEEGKLTGMADNPVATLLWAGCIAPHPLTDEIVGPLLVVQTIKKH